MIDIDHTEHTEEDALAVLQALELGITDDELDGELGKEIDSAESDTPILHNPPEVLGSTELHSEETDPLDYQQDAQEIDNMTGTQQFLSLVEPFSGDPEKPEEDFGDFLSSVRMASTSWIASLPGKISDQDKNFIRMKCLKAGLKGEALSALEEIDPKKDAKNFEKVQDFLTLKYAEDEEDDEKVEQVLEQFRGMTQGTMTVVKYCDHAMALLNKLPRAERERKGIAGHFLRGLKSEAMMQGALSNLKNKYTIREAMAAVRKQNRLYEAREEQEDEKKKDKPSEMDGVRLLGDALALALQKGGYPASTEEGTPSAEEEKRVVKFKEPIKVQSHPSNNSQSSQFGRTNSPWCFKCGKQGHLSPHCKSTVEITWDQRKELQNKMGWTPRVEAVASVNTSSSARMGDRQPYVDEFEQRQNGRIRETNMVEVWRPTEAELAEYERTHSKQRSKRVTSGWKDGDGVVGRGGKKLGSRVRPLVEVNEVTGKRDRSDGSGENPTPRQRLRQEEVIPRRMAIPRLLNPEKGGLGRSSNYRPPRVEEETAPMMIKTKLDAEQVQNLIQKAEQRAEKRRSQSSVTRPREAIKALGDQKPLDAGWLLRNFYTVLQGSEERVSLAQWLDVSPGFRAQMVKELGKIKPGNRLRTVTQSRPPPQHVNVISVVNDGSLHQASPEQPLHKTIHNFYTAVVFHLPNGNRATVRRTLIDAGAMVSIISKSVVKALGLVMFGTPPLFMKSVTDEIVALNYVVQAKFEVAGIVCKHSLYVNSGDASFTVILGRRWLQQMKVIGDYEKETYSVTARDGFTAQVPREHHQGEGKRTAHVFRSEQFVEAEPTTEEEAEEWEEEERQAVREVLESAKSEEYEALWSFSEYTEDGEEEEPTEDTASAEDSEEDTSGDITDSESSTESEYDTPDYDSTIDFSTDIEIHRSGKGYPRL